MSKLFQGFNIIVVDQVANDTKCADLKKLLYENGCEYVVNLHIDGLLYHLQEHYMPDKPDFIISDIEPVESISRAFQLMVPIVNSEWVYKCSNKGKIVPVEPYQYICDTLRNTKIHISRYSFNQHEYKFLSNLIYLLGGYVTDSISPKSITQYMIKSNGKVDKISEAMELSEEYTEVEFIDEKWLLNKFYQSQFNNNCIIESIDEDDSTNLKDNNIQPFKNYQFLINLQMCESLIAHLSTMIKIQGGSIVSREEFEFGKDNNNTVYLTEFNGIERVCVNCPYKVNLQWVFDCILQQKMIHINEYDIQYLIPTMTQHKLCDNLKISYTQFFGLKRNKIINQIEMLGGEPQSFLYKYTDILIVGKPHGSKYEYAKKNDIPMVTTYWLEESFEQNERLPGYNYDPTPPTRFISTNLNYQLNKQYGNIPILNKDDVESVKDIIITSSPSSEDVAAAPPTQNIEIPLTQPEKKIATIPSEKFIEDSIPTQDDKHTGTNPINDIPSSLSNDTDTPLNPLPSRKRFNTVTTEDKSKNPRPAKRKKSEEKAIELLSQCMNEIKPLYNIHCVTTQCLDKLTECDKETLRLIGIVIYDEINNDNIKLLNSVIAPKRLRTLKFLISLSFEPLEYALLPKFITDLLKLIKKGVKDTSLQLDVMQYCIPDMDERILRRTELPEKVFARSRISSINLSSNMQGGTNTLKTILQCHGIKTVNVLKKKKFTLDDVVINAKDSTSSTSTVPQYILITDQQSQMKQFKSAVAKESHKGTNTLIVEWNWCVQCIFSLEVSYDKDKNPTILYYA